MTSIEALWSVRFGTSDYDIEDLEGGVMVVETNRIYGGDSIYAYSGDLKVDRDSVVGKLSVVRHNWSEGTQSLYGTQERMFAITFVGERDGVDRVAGRLVREGFPDAFFVMTRLQNLT